MESEKFYVINSKVLPDVFKEVIYAKELLASGKAINTSQAIKLAGISRSAFYKYKDFVFNYTDNKNKTVTLFAVLSDKVGVFSALTTVLYKYGANILTVNQSIPVDSAANVTLTISTEKLSIKLEKLLKMLTDVEGVISIKTTNGGKND